jgi:hypothetical protein
MAAEYILAPNPLWDAIKQTGVPAAYGYLFTYVSGTRTYKATYQDPAGLNPNTNPVRLSSAGQAVIYWKQEEGFPLYTIRLFAASEVDGVPGQLLYETDNYPNTGAQSGGGSIITIYSNNDNYFRNEQFTWWTHGTQFLTADLPAGDTQVADSWYYRRGNTNADITISRQTFIPGNDPPPANSPHYIEYLCTTAASDTVNLLYEKFYSVQSLQNTQVTVRFWARTKDIGTTSTISIYIEQFFGVGGSATPAPTLFSQVIDDQWTLYAQTFTVPSVVGQTIGTGGDDYLLIGLQYQINQTIGVHLSDVYFQPGLGTGSNFPYRTQNDQYNNILQDVLAGYGDEEGTNIIGMDPGTAGREPQILYDYLQESFREATPQNLLIGWNFPTNPRQFGAPLLANNAQYIADQTILLSDGNGVVEQISVRNEPLVLSVQISNKKFGIFQIIESANSAMLNNTVQKVASMMVSMTSSQASTYKMALIGWNGIFDAQAKNAVAAWNSAGADPSLTAGWNYLNAPNSTYIINATSTFSDFIAENISVGSGFTSYGVFVWNDSADMTAGGTVFFNEISLVNGINAAHPAALDAGTVLTQCQRYFQRSYSYLAGEAPVITALSAMSVLPVSTHNDKDPTFPWVDGAGVNVERTIRVNSSFNEISFNTEMWKPPSVATYSPSSGAANKGDADIEYTGTAPFFSGSTQVDLSTNNVSTQAFKLINTFATVTYRGTANGQSVIINYQPCILFHYVADATLGV